MSRKISELIIELLQGELIDNESRKFIQKIYIDIEMINNIMVKALKQNRNRIIINSPIHQIITDRGKEEMMKEDYRIYDIEIITESDDEDMSIEETEDENEDEKIYEGYWGEWKPEYTNEYGDKVKSKTKKIKN